MFAAISRHGLISVLFCCYMHMIESGREWEYPARCYEWVDNHFVSKTLELHPHAPARSKTFETDPPQGKYKNKGTGGQDLMVVDVFEDKNDGYFVDLAANQWQDSSNTWLIETWSHWRGVCIEANPLYHVELLGFRRCKLFVNPVSSQPNELISFNVVQKGGGGIVNQEYMNKNPTEHDLKLNTTTLELILDFAEAPSVIDYLSLDIEGAEYAAMQNFPFHRYLFLMMTVERPTAQLHQLLSQHGYHFVQQMAIFGEALYFHRALPNFHKLMVKHGHTEIPSWKEGDGYEEYPRPYLLHPFYPGFDTYNLSEIQHARAKYCKMPLAKCSDHVRPM